MRVVRKEVVPAFSLWLVEDHLLPVTLHPFPYVFGYKFSFYKITWLKERPVPLGCDLILTNISVMALFPNKTRSEVPGVRTPAYGWGGGQSSPPVTLPGGLFG